MKPVRFTACRPISGIASHPPSQGFRLLAPDGLRFLLHHTWQRRNQADDPSRSLFPRTVTGQDHIDRRSYLSDRSLFYYGEQLALRRDSGLEHPDMTAVA
ncbi:MAG: hypothetical protein OXF56_10920 [Rhodobacteraceae bacterium]|nr:hypothetical protein [Paracoccaceae bacterium]